MGVEESLKAIILCLKIDSLKTQALVVKVTAFLTIHSFGGMESIFFTMRKDYITTLKIAAVPYGLCQKLLFCQVVLTIKEQCYFHRRSSKK